MKRLFDILLAATGLLVGSVILLPAAVAVWLQDFHSPLYIASRIGRGGTPFRMVKLRSMRILADQTGVMSTAGDDPRITRIGRLVRKLKLDELTQLWNVLRGDMSLVGPRPQVAPDVARYTAEERQMLAVRPGITDLASIVFADEGAILEGAEDPDLRYNQVIRPWKSRLALLYVRAPYRIGTDLRLIVLTVLTAVARPRALDGVAHLAAELGADAELVAVAHRRAPLRKAPPPGATEVVQALTA
jgi:lipopolysaccharide/colanic/teichoic acid biosynthesis glycosyltransferase